jgi:hypothetical protein
MLFGCQLMKVQDLLHSRAQAEVPAFAKFFLVVICATIPNYNQTDAL